MDKETQVLNYSIHVQMLNYSIHRQIQELQYSYTDAEL